MQNYGIVKEAFVSYCRESGKPRGFGFVVFESRAVADRVVQNKHTIDRREVSAHRRVHFLSLRTGALGHDVVQ